MYGWAHSSVWIEWLPAEQLVVGSNPSEPVIFKHYGSLVIEIIHQQIKTMMIKKATSHLYLLIICGILVTTLTAYLILNFLAKERSNK